MNGLVVLFLLVFVAPMVLACALGSVRARRDVEMLPPNNLTVGSPAHWDEER